MKKKIVFFIIVLCIVLIFFYKNSKKEYEKDYFKQVGFDDIPRLWELEKVKGKPKKIETDEESGIVYTYYDGLCLVFSRGGAFIRMEITDEKYSFGKYHVKVGVNIKEVKKIYKNCTKIKDEPQNSFGVIDGEAWVSFEYSTSGEVEKIIMTLGI